MSICNNKKAFHDYFIEDKYEVGLVLQGWEVKAIRAGKAQLRDSYVKIIRGELYLLGCSIAPLSFASTHIVPDATRVKKLLLHKKEINKLIGKVDQSGYTLVTLDLHYIKGNVKATIAIAKGKKDYDKRTTLKNKELSREAAIAIKTLKNKI